MKIYRKKYGRKLIIDGEGAFTIQKDWSHGIMLSENVLKNKIIIQNFNFYGLMPGFIRKIKLSYTVLKYIFKKRG